MAAARHPEGVLNNRWILLIGGSIIATNAIVVGTMLLGISVFISHFLYIPVILTAYRYPKKGVAVSAALALVYFTAHELLLAPPLLETFVAAGRSGMFVVIGGVVAFLSGRIRSKEEQYRAVVEGQTELICRFLPDGTLLFANDAFSRYFGKNPQDLIGTVFRPEIPGDDRPAVTAHFAALTQNHPAGMIEHRIVMPDGRIRWQQWNDHAFFDEAGHPCQYQSVGRDITDRREMEEALIQSEELYRTIFETTGSGMVMLDRDGTMLLANEELESQYGISRRNLIGTNAWQQFIAPEDRDRVLDLFSRRFTEADTVPRSYEARFLDASGMPRDMILTVSLLPGAQRSLVSLLDITARKQAERLIEVANAINTLIVRERDAGMLLGQACRELSYLDRFLVAAIAEGNEDSLREPFLSDDSYKEQIAALFTTPELAGAVKTCTPALVPTGDPAISCAFAIPMCVDGRLRGVMLVCLLSGSALGEQDLDSLQVLANDLAYALKMIDLEDQKRDAIEQIEKNMEQFSILNDHIRNPLQGIVGYADLTGGEVAERIMPLCDEVNRIVNLLDNRFLASEKIRDFLLRHYNIRIRRKT